MPELAPHYQIHVHKKGSLKVLELHAEWSEEFYRDMGEAEFVKKKIQEALKQNCFITIRLVLHPPKTLPRSEGKAVRIVSPAVENAVT